MLSIFPGLFLGHVLRIRTSMLETRLDLFGQAQAVMMVSDL